MSVGVLDGVSVTVTVLYKAGVIELASGPHVRYAVPVKPLAVHPNCVITVVE